MTELAKTTVSGQRIQTVTSRRIHVHQASPMPCGCGRTSTHNGGRGTNCMALMSGCAQHVRRWMRDGYTPEVPGFTMGADGYYRKNGVRDLAHAMRRRASTSTPSSPRRTGRVQVSNRTPTGCPIGQPVRPRARSSRAASWASGGRTAAHPRMALPENRNTLARYVPSSISVLL